MKQAKMQRWFKNGVWAGFFFTILSGFAVFNLSGVLKWNIHEGQTVKLLLNPSGCNCKLTEAEILEIFYRSMARWNGVTDSFFAFQDWADVAPDSLSPKEKQIYEELKKNDPTFRKSTPKLGKDDGINVVGFSNEVPPFASAFAANRFEEEGNHFKESDVFIGQNLDFTKATLEFVVTHELGHVLGLAHDQADSAAVMSYGRNPNSNSRLGADDITGAVFLYPKEGVGEPEVDWGCTTILPIDSDSSFFDKALLGFLFFMALMVLALALTKRYEKQKNRLSPPMFWKRFLQGGLMGGLVLVLAVACAESLEENQALPQINRIDVRHLKKAQTLHRFSGINFAHPPQPTPHPIVVGNTLRIYD